MGFILRMQYTVSYKIQGVFSQIKNSVFGIPAIYLHWWLKFDQFLILWYLKHLQLYYWRENTYEWKLKIKVMWLWVRGRQLSQNAYFMCAICQVEFRRHGARKRDGQCTLKLHLIFLFRNALSSANFRIAHLGPWLSAMTS